jgi:hypothetical protein
MRWKDDCESAVNEGLEGDGSVAWRDSDIFLFNFLNILGELMSEFSMFIFIPDGKKKQFSLLIT